MTLILVALAVAPWGVLALAAVIRGYDLHLTMRRRHRDRDD